MSEALGSLNTSSGSIGNGGSSGESCIESKPISSTASSTGKGGNWGAS